MSSQSAYAEAYDYVRERIRDGRLRSGARIKSEDIASELGISRMPVREAIRQLDSEGLVTIRANRGAVVTVLNPEEILELFEMRSVLEGIAIKRAIDRFDEDAFTTLEMHLLRLERAQGDFSHWIARHNDFHDFICAQSGARRLFTDVQRLRTAVEPYLRIVLGTPQSENALAEHRKLIDAIRQGDPRIAEEVIRKHILETAHDLIRTMALKS
jgi:DNA-binding GntR family transcriptional regulator